MTAHGAAAGRRLQLDTLTGVRGVAGLIVFVVHCGTEPVYRNSSINDRIVWLFTGAGEAAVSFFFMLSGFVLVWAWRPHDTRRGFWRRRVVKIYPNHLTTWTAGLVLALIAGEITSAGAAASLLPSLPLVHVWIPLEKVVAGTDGPAWSLSVEVFFYALFPLMLARLNRVPVERLRQVLVGALLAVAAVTALIGVVVPHEPTAFGLDASVYQGYLLIFFPPMRLFDFLIGMVVARLVIAGRWPEGVRWWWIGALYAVGWVLSVTLPMPLGFVAPMLVPNLLLVGKAATMDLSRRSSVFTRRAVVWLGDVSFAFYLVHWLVLHYGRVFLGGVEPHRWSTPVGTAFFAGAFVLSLGLAELLRRGVELPAMRRWARSRRAAPSSPAAPTPA